MRRFLALFLPQLVLWVLVSQANHVLAQFHVYLVLGALFVVYAALTMPLRVGLLTSFAAGLLHDSQASVAFGLHAVLFGLTHALLFYIRDRVPRDETVARVVIALLSNLAFFLVFSFTQIGGLPSPAEVWPRLIWDLLWSQLAITLVAPWFFALQSRSLVVARVARDEPV